MTVSQTITISVEIDSRADYVGAIATFEPLPGEEHQRSKDLTDGPLTVETVEQIVADIRALLIKAQAKADPFAPDLEATP